MDRRPFHAELEELQEAILKMGTLVERAIHDAVKALAQKNLSLAQAVESGDAAVDDMQLAIENNCLALLALRQPVARDLRTIGTALKIVTDLERMGDHAVGIARVAIRLHGEPLIKPLIDVPRMAEIAQGMVRDSLTAYIEGDLRLARRLASLDDEVDHLYAQVFRELLTYMMADPRTINQATHLLLVAQHLERIADHATNLGEWVVYAVTGKREKMNE